VLKDLLGDGIRSKIRTQPEEFGSRGILLFYFLKGERPGCRHRLGMTRREFPAYCELTLLLRK